MACLRTTNGSTLGFVFRPGTILQDQGVEETRHTVGPEGAELPEYVSYWALNKYDGVLARMVQPVAAETFLCQVGACGRIFETKRGLSMHLHAHGVTPPDDEEENSNGDGDDTGDNPDVPSPELVEEPVPA